MHSSPVQFWQPTTLFISIMFVYCYAFHNRISLAESFATSYPGRRNSNDDDEEEGITVEVAGDVDRSLQRGWRKGTEKLPTIHQGILRGHEHFKLGMQIS
ncbi:unnamed protein product [Cuscuta campestris]|uniref:Uncharacterized protein n=1 Tax=Cuscuta campestris TaxID=132261 RepID=A0A484KHC2_9ASTE|nr:unnamed protein product [Cuscuta campestris]